jgi:hypothetical protein
MPRRHAESLGTKETNETKDETSAQDALKTTTICRQESSGKLRMEVLQKKKARSHQQDARYACWFVSPKSACF